jgi:gamma-glutamyl:cysteine ligase YbdK (ATP-grasp superfamily)
MGRDVSRDELSDPGAFVDKLRVDGEALAEILRSYDLSVQHPTVGIEIEFSLVDDAARPTLRNVEALGAIADADFQTELGRFNLEINVAPARIAGSSLRDTEETLRKQLNAAELRASGVPAHLMMIGILPTLFEEHLTAEAISDDDRYQVLSERILAARKEDIDVTIAGAEQLRLHADSIMPEAACTSTQLHLQVSPDNFAAVWNSAQAIACAQVAVGANSPFFVGRELWHETRIAVFEQATDSRDHAARLQGARPRVWFGERWIGSVLDLFEENARYFDPLLPVLDDEDPFALLAAGQLPALPELSLHNGSVWRWNRPIFQPAGDGAHIRIENRVLPAGPTVVDTIANAAFFFGLVTAMSDAEPGPWVELEFTQAEANFHLAARYGLDAEVVWPGLGRVPVARLVLDSLLPAAAEGLDSLGVESAVAGKYLDIVAARTACGRTGSQWLISARHADSRLSSREALRVATARYRELMHEGEPVHTWPDVR